MKKQSFYVWFLGAQEARGAQDDRFVRPVLKYLLDREKELEPTKVTLQVSCKGLKIVQNIIRSKTSKKDQMKHLIPPHSVAWVMRAEPPHEDIVCCTLLIQNPVTKCPVHIHAYRCDSVETARSLRYQLTQLMAEAQKSSELKNLSSTDVLQSGFSPHGLRPPRVSNPTNGSCQRRIGSDGRSTRTDEEDPDFEGDAEDEISRNDEDYGGSAENVFNIARSMRGLSTAEIREKSARLHEEPDNFAVTPPPDSRVVRLYDSLAQELKAKLAGTNHGLQTKTQKPPLLLPPKDYDTVCRKQGNLLGIDFRRSTNQNIVGRTNPSDESAQSADESALPKTDHEGKFPTVASPQRKSSSGVGSEEIPFASRSSKHHLDQEATVETSDDEWNYRAAERYGIHPDGKQRTRHRSMDFLQQRLDHFHMGETRRTTSSQAEKHREETSTSLEPRSHSKPTSHASASMTYFGQHGPQPLRSLGNSNYHDVAVPQNLPQPASYVGSGSSSLQLVTEVKKGGEAGRTARAHERPISFPTGVIPVRRDIPLTQVPTRSGFHQHPMKESIIEPVINQQHKRRLGPGTRVPFEQSLLLLPPRKPVLERDPIEPKAPHLAQRLRSPTNVMGFSPENIKPRCERQPDYRRQSLAEFGEGPTSHIRRNPLAKYLSSSLERRAYGSRYSVAESHGHRLY
ncbi:uncharacterized protein LOC100900118 [Galendromus occidentalis]|uniref:Uncharacterized protein LOC100900118 n=1 Tax=Galendromus occidentalis TaxID=34638 RepID=A0AAJ7SEH5_9ACAR|nr:uncharacterized protein LOC100900118 [Galendromus occidentalis]